MITLKDEIKFIEYNGIEGYIELMKHDVEPLNNPECKGIELYYDGRDIKALLDYITNLQERAVYYDKYKDCKSRIDKALDKLYCYGEVFDSKVLQQFQKEMENILKGDDE